MGNIIHTTEAPLDDVNFRWMVGRWITLDKDRFPGQWRFNIGSGAWLRVGSFWRVVGTRVELTSEDHGHPYGHPAPIDAVVELEALLSDRVIEDVTIRSDTLDLVIRFEDGSCLEINTNSSGYECWEVHAPGGACFVAGGGQISTWTNAEG